MDAVTPQALHTHGKGAVKASDLLLELLDAFPNERVTVGELLKRLDGRAYGLLLILLALPMCIPNIPGISTVFAVMMFVPAIQMVVGRGHAWLPRRVCAWSFSREALGTGLRTALPILKRIERLAKPRWSRLVSPPTLPAWGLVTFIMALVLILPLPFANFPVGVAMTAIALALLQQDGVIGVVGVVLAAATVVWTYVLLKTSGAILKQLGEWISIITAWMP